MEDLYGVKITLGPLQLQQQLAELMATYQACSSLNWLPNLNGERMAVQECEMMVDGVVGFSPIVMKVVRSFGDYNLAELYHCIGHATVK